MDTLVLILIILLVASAFGGVYTGRSGYSGAGAGMGNILYGIAALVLVVIVLRLLRVI